MSAKAGYERGEDVATRSAPGIGAYPNPDDPMPHGPWDPVIRAAIERAGYLFRSLETRPYARQWEIGAFPQQLKTFEHGLLSDPYRMGPYAQPLRAYEHGLLPDPYRLGPSPEPWSFYGARYAELNPQPLPPLPPVETRSYIQAVSLAREILERAEYLQHSIEAARTEGTTTQGEELPRNFVMGFAKHFASNLATLPVDPFGGFDYGRPPKPNWLQAILIGCLLKSASTFDSTHAKLRLVLEEAGNLLVNAGLSKQPGTETRASH